MLRLLRLLFVLFVRSLCSRRDLLSRPSAAACRSEAEASTTEVQDSGQDVSGSSEPALARLGTVPDAPAARDGRSLAPSGIQIVLEVDFSASCCRWEKMRERRIA